MDGQNNLELGFINESVNLYNVDNKILKGYDTYQLKITLK